MSDNQTITLIPPDAISTVRSKYNIFDPLPPDEFANMKATIAQHGVLCPIIMDEEGNVIEGYHRSLASKELGIPCPAFVRHFESEAEKMEIAAATNANRRHLSREQKRTVIARYLKADPEIADNFLAELLGVSKNTVADVRLELEATCQIDKLTELRGKDGKMRPREMPKANKPEAKKPEAEKPKPPTKAGKSPQTKPTAPAGPSDDFGGNVAGDGHASDEDEADEETNDEEQAELTQYSVSWRRVSEGQATVAASDPDAAARKVRQMAEQQTALDIQSKGHPNVEVNQVEDSTGKTVAVSRTGELGLGEEATTAPPKAVEQKAAITPNSLSPRVSDGFVVLVEKKGKLGYKTDKHDDKRWLLIAHDERAAKLAVNNCVPQPTAEHTNGITNNKPSTAGVCFITALDDDTLDRTFIPWEEV
jgi:ParB-like chromosome segregation protein Spo0J